MNAHPVLEKQLDWLLTHSLQAGVLVLLVLLAQWIFRRQLTSRWRFALWWIVLARLLLPFSPHSALSLFNFYQPHIALGVVPAPSRPVSAVAIAPQGETPPVLSVPEPAGPIQPIQPRMPPAVIPPVPSFHDLLIPGLACLWLAGVLGLTSVVAIPLIKFYGKLARASAPPRPALRRLFDECHREFGLSQPMELVETNAVQSPALFGLLRLRLLLPRRMGEQFSEGELRYIFLHELAHVKRGDLWLNWLVTALQILHWFNPFLWLGFARLRADRELACDELALLSAGDNAGLAYGETVVKLLENLSRPAAIPGLVGILEDTKQMRRRISTIANFRKPGRWSALAALLAAGLAATALTDGQSNMPVAARPDLAGHIFAKGGKPLPVKATVFIATAAPKSGTSAFCPSCYADCGKHTRTDAAGGFKINGLDPQLTFQLLAVAKGYQPKYLSKVDPAKGLPVKMELSPIESSEAERGHSIRGRVVDPQGKPIEGAVVEMDGIYRNGGGGGWGSLPGVDQLAATDEKGEFLLTAKKPFREMTVKVKARLYADKIFDKLPSGPDLYKLPMAEGATLTGRVLSHGQPLAGIAVGISGVERTPGSYLGHFEVGTSASGKFAFLNLPPDADFSIYTLMDTMKNSGAAPIQKIHTGKDGETTDTGDLQAGPAHRLAGRVVLADGQPLPSATRLLVSREGAWDSSQITLGPDGAFDVIGIPMEIISLSARVKGYNVSAQNVSIDQLNPFRLTGRMDRDVTNLVLLLEKGPAPEPDFSHIDPDYDRARQSPLRGAESGPDHSHEWAISGHVLDRDTKQPLQNFRVTPGQSENVGQIGWKTVGAADGSNGLYKVYVNKHATLPLLKVEADGYLPEMKTVLPDAPTADFILRKGSGPAGKVVTPDGKPAVGAAIVVLDGSFNQASLNSEGELTADSNEAIRREADKNGKFSFNPILGMKSLAAASSNGFSIVTLESFSTNPTIVLEPFGKIIGTLKRADNLSANESLDLMFDRTDLLYSPSINLSNPTTTDAQGRFDFERVPAGHLQISCREQLGLLGPLRVKPLQAVDLKPGQTLELNITAPNRPTVQDLASRQPQPPKPIPGVVVKGIVVLPNGRPAAAAEVALQIEGKYLAIGKGVFTSSSPRNEGWLVTAGQDGSFTLPMYEGATAIIALNDEGYAQVSLKQLKTSPQVTLQKWGRIEGTLRIGRHLGANEQITIEGGPSKWRQAKEGSLGLPFFDFNAFRTETDEQGRFVLTFIPPGQQTLVRLMPLGGGSSRNIRIATVEVKPGETTVTNVGGTGRTVIGRLKFTGGAASELKSGFITLYTPVPKTGHSLKTDHERKAFYQSREYQASLKDLRSFSALAQPDGSFQVEDVLPGRYQVSFQQRDMMFQFSTFAPPQECIVPTAQKKGDDSLVDLGEIDFKASTLPGPQTSAAAK